MGASAEFGNMQGAVINVVTRQGSERFLYDASYYGQTAGMTSQPVRLAIPGPGQRESGYERARYRDVTTNLGGPAIRDRCGSSPDISTSAITTASPAPIRSSRGRTSRTRSSRNSHGSSLRACSCYRAFTTSSG
jgi:hypothetical protein